MNSKKKKTLENLAQWVIKGTDSYSVFGSIQLHFHSFEIWIILPFRVGTIALSFELFLQGYDILVYEIVWKQFGSFHFLLYIWK